MINVIPAYYRALANGYRKFVPEITITLMSGTVLNLTEADIWQNGLTIEDAVSGESDFQVGAAIINKCEIQLNNMDGRFTEYVFEGATVLVKVKLNFVDDVSGQSRTYAITKGTFIVNESQFDDTIVTLECYDSMVLFDAPYTTNLTYPSNVGLIVSDACAKCGVTLDNSGLPSGWGTLQVQKKPDAQSVTYRNVISWCAQMFGRYARISNENKLQIKWFDSGALSPLDYDGGIFDDANPYASGDNLDGGSFDNGSPYYSSGDSAEGGTFGGSSFPNANVLEGVFTHKVSLDDVVITGVRVLIKNPDASSGSPILAYTEGQEGYLIEISDNPFIDIANVGTVLNILGGQLIAMRFRKATVTHLANPVIEAGDIAYFSDRSGNEFHICVTKTVYTISDNQTTTCSAQDPARNSVQQFSTSARNYVENYQLVRQESNLRQSNYNTLNQAINSHAGLYTTIEESPVGSGSYIYYMHDMPQLANSHIVWKLTTEAIAVTTNYQADPVVWEFGVTSTGLLVANIMDTIGINFSWGVGGELRIQDRDNNTTLYANAENGQVDINAHSFRLQNTSIPQIVDMVQYGVCSTGSTTKAKTVQIQDFELFTGAKIVVKFEHENVANAPTLNVSGTGPKEIQAYGHTLAASGEYSKYNWSDNASLTLLYDGVYWSICDSSSMAVSLDAVDEFSASLDQQEVFDRLTNNQADQGIYLSNGNLYVNASMINTGFLSFDRAKGGTLNIGGSNNTNGVFQITDASGNVIGRWDKDGLVANTGGKLQSANGRVYFDLTNNEMACTTIKAGTDDSSTGLGTVIDVEEQAQWAEDLTIKNHKFVNIYKNGTSQKDYGLMIEPTSSSGLCAIRCAGGIKLYYPSNNSASEIYGSTLLVNANGLFLYDKYGNAVFGTNTSYGTAGAVFPGTALFQNDVKFADFVEFTSSANRAKFEYPPKLFNITSYGGSILGLAQDGATICIHTSSSKRYKDIDRELTAKDIEKAYDIKVYRAKYKEGYLQKSDPKDGVYMPMFVAENVEECIPEAVYYKNDKVEDWDFHVIIPVQHQMILDQNRRIKELKSEVDTLKNELKEIKELLLKRGDK